MKEKDPIVERLTNFTLYLIFVAIAALVASGVVIIIIWMFNRILGRC